jgi:REP element-mobilizing transposase RayT
LEELKRLREEWTKKHLNSKSSEWLQDLDKLIYQRVEYWLDQGMGSCILGEEQASLSIHRSMQYFQSNRYELGASVVMPNHVHCIVRPFESSAVDLENIVGGWKSYSAREIHRAFECVGPIWLDEAYDRIIRDEEHLWRCIQYIGSNPKKVGLTGVGCRLWINPEWESLGWRFV